MKWVALAFAVCLTTAAAQTQEMEVGILTIGEIDADLVTRVSSHIQEVTGIRSHTKPPMAILEKDPETQAKTLGGLLSSNEFCLLVLMNISQDVEFSEGYFPSQHVIMLNVRALRPPNLSTEEGVETHLRRIEKQSLFLLGRLVGLEICPFPLCVMKEIAGMEDLDQKPRDFCPPCKGRLMDLLGRGEGTLSLPVPAEDVPIQ